MFALSACLLASRPCCISLGSRAKGPSPLSAHSFSPRWHEAIVRFSIVARTISFRFTEGREQALLSSLFEVDCA